jgi:Arc/MetJ-type ribon-helix-helix transcriptional regulator
VVELTVPSHIPKRYRFGMSKQIAVRLPDDLVDFLDDLVASGDEASRASMVTRALIREKRRLGALRDVEILKRLRPDKEMESLARWASQVTEDID